MAGERAEYKSAQRSRQKIREALLQLLQHQDLRKITVSELVRVAGINRTTFYAHYPDVTGVVEEIGQELIDKLHEVIANVHSRGYWQNPEPLLAEVNAFLRQNAEPYRVLIRLHGVERFTQRLKAIFVEGMMEDPSIPPPVRQSKAFQLQVLFFAGGIENLYVQWLTGTADCTLEEIGDQLVVMMRQIGQKNRQSDESTLPMG